MASLNELNGRAGKLQAAGRTAEALAVLRACVDLAPGNAAVRHNLAAALGDAGRHAEAVDWARRAVQAGIDAPETWLVIGRGLAALGKVDEAEIAFGQALQRRPTDLVVHRDLAQLRWMATGNRAQALESIDRAIARHPTDAGLRLIRSQVLGHTGDAPGEYEEALAALRIGGNHPQLRLAAANAALAAGAADEAVGHAQVAAAAIPDDSAIAQALCRAWLAVGEPNRAAALAGRLRERFPLDQSIIAIEATAWRLLGDARYHEVCDFDSLVLGFPLDRPPGWASAERYVDDLVEALDRQHHFEAHPFGQSVRHGSQLPSIDTLDEAPLKALGAALQAPVRSYLARLGPGDDVLRRRQRGGFRRLGIWSVRLVAGGHHVSHVHPQGWLSSACHLRFPSPADAEDRRGWLSFGEPGVATRPSLSAEHLVRPARGVLVLFPSYFWHATLPFDGPGTRLSMAADWLPDSASD